MSRITTFKCDRCGALIGADDVAEQVTKARFGKPDGSVWVADLCSACFDHFRQHVTLTAQKLPGRKKKAAAA